VPRTRDVDHVQIVLPDDAIQMDPRKCLAGVGTPMPQQSILEMLRAERLPEQRIVAQVDHARAKIVAGAPICIDLAKLFSAKCLFGRSRLPFTALRARHRPSIALRRLF
jgi:hypothetical protein